ncbi:type II toxin-antitoxin system PemK/MazF family toxin [Mucilaginibacter sp.]|uniref:type II toxin-antitoxin system PemK/MazF family toxin n=1 Tax=Mucilaginibacter sp. TaxID=1882438 RepID=UPI0028417FC0|nr:type II toxin-antitoxin system PemK/MazF family toxin [Mucilaginibacter sp.]MDR3695199.1 type II toxin-antitoxin system PemK/MazF family toxin [Mucilaginibacter sp.]
MVITQYAVHWINLDPTMGGEVNKTRPCVIISPDEMNKYLRTVIIAPLTHTLKIYPSRVLCDINGDKGSIMLDQIRTVDKTRIGNLLGKLKVAEIAEIKSVINQMLC